MDDELLALAAARAINYRRGIGDQAVFPAADALASLRSFVESLPDDSREPADVMDQLDRLGSPGTVASVGGRYFGFVTGGVHPVALSASWLSAAWDQNAALGVMSPTAAVLDTVVGGWLLDLFGLPPTAQHQFVTGTSMANAVGIAAGRDALLHDSGWDSVQSGLFGAPEIRVVVSEAAHLSVSKALGFTGLGRDRIIRVAADDQGRLDPNDLPEPGPPTLVIAQAGHVNSGSFDPLAAIADHFDGSPHWIHVDGAFGLWAATMATHRHLTEGMNRAHSWGTDLHKWLNTTYDSAVVIVRDREDLARSFQLTAEYLPPSERLEPMHRGPEMSQRARAIEAWAVMSTLGRAGIEEHGKHLCEMTRLLAARLLKADFEVHNDVVLNQLLVSGQDDDETDALVTAAQRSGRVWCAPTEWRGRRVIRLSICSAATSTDDLDVVEQVLDDARHGHRSQGEKSL